MLNVVLFQPEIPPNTGNVIRLCANCGFSLHLIEPLGFIWDDKRLTRAGLDYHEFASITRHADFTSFIEIVQPGRVLALSTRGTRYYHEHSYQAGDTLLFGSETRGLPRLLLEQLGNDNILRIPMKANSRSMNLSNTVALVAWEAWRQLDFSGSI
jgi:tRNA (cytidine/uridine-2'-O-)-methyltransferase